MQTEPNSTLVSQKSRPVPVQGKTKQITMTTNPITQSKITVPSNLTSTVQDLSTSLTAIKPNNSETTQIITYTLIATAVVGIFVYHYIKTQETLE